MKYYNELQQEIIEYLLTRKDLYYHGYTGTHFFKTWDKGEDKYSIESLRPHGDKSNISAELYIYSSRYSDNDPFGIEIRIDMYMWGYQSEETVFQGWVENMKELKIILKSVGL